MDNTLSIHSKHSNALRRVLAVFLAISMLSGCVGIGVIKTHTDTKIVGSDSHFECPGKKIGALNVSCETGTARSYTPEKLRALWGEPDSYQATAGVEYLMYHRSVAWRGPVILAILPIPLLVPVGHNDTTLIFKNGVLTQTKFEGFASAAVGCGFYNKTPSPGGPNDFGCFATDWQ